MRWRMLRGDLASTHEMTGTKEPSPPPPPPAATAVTLQTLPSVPWGPESPSPRLRTSVLKNEKEILPLFHSSALQGHPGRRREVNGQHS